MAKLLRDKWLMIKKSTIINLKLGSEEAFNAIYVELMPLVKQICYFYFNDNNIAEDITIETFIKLWNHRYAIDENKNLKYYITQIAHNLCRDYLRKSKNEEKTNVELMKLLEMPFEESKEDEMLFNKIEMLIDRDSYMMLVYKFVHKLKHREIAKIMGLTTSIVTNKISRSLKTLKEKMNNEK
ncbi:RNA polymerase sigma factor [Paracholeplasma manati]|uniref:RNA polymerase sigma factor n=1 Tax=Paracholeplasma manati TaxID=591373 RepID=UPI002407A583|nr:sigma-70 family RNA polymerase sigma factor [Paracholeplasma manati]MDG0889591.1 sigma-70 family RNA polymerase sigma factor [Paracholeplasma manati]